RRARPTHSPVVGDIMDTTANATGPVTDPTTAETGLANRKAAPGRAGRWNVLKNGRVAFPLTVLVILALVTIAAPLVAPYSPTQLLGAPLQEPVRSHSLGTDHFGRVVLSRLIYAGRVSLGVAAGSVALATIAGVT